MIAQFRFESRKVGTHKWQQTSHTTSHWSSAVMVWMELTQSDVTTEWRIVGEWVRTAAEQSEGEN